MASVFIIIWLWLFCWLSFNVHICVYNVVSLSLFPLVLSLSVPVFCSITFRPHSQPSQTYLWSHICNFSHVFIHWVRLCACVYIYLFPMHKSILKTCLLAWRCFFSSILILFLRSFSFSSFLIQMRLHVYVRSYVNGFDWVFFALFFFVNFGHRSHSIIAYLIISFFSSISYVSPRIFFIEILTAKRVSDWNENTIKLCVSRRRALTLTLCFLLSWIKFQVKSRWYFLFVVCFSLPCSELEWLVGEHSAFEFVANMAHMKTVTRTHTLIPYSLRNSIELICMWVCLCRCLFLCFLIFFGSALTRNRLLGH